MWHNHRKIYFLGVLIFYIIITLTECKCNGTILEDFAFSIGCFIGYILFPSIIIGIIPNLKYKMDIILIVSILLFMFTEYEHNLYNEYKNNLTIYTNK